MITDTIRSYEQQRLKRTISEIDAQLQEINHIVGDRRGDVVSIREEMWSDLPKVIRDFDDAVIFTQHQQLLDQQEREYLIFRRLIPRLERLRASAYFGRIDFQRTEDTRPSEIYIGIASLVSQSSGEHLIYDWRAPISSMFYDFEPGPAHYEAAEGTIQGEMLLKRQYKIEGDTIVYFFDTDLKIDDDLLQSILGRTVEPKMRTIVQSIQREQNRAIRDESHNLLIVSGPAGSGKTSIALHRVAYLLYRRRGDLHSSDMTIISPNDVFNDYISRVLPDLGEENVRQLTFGDLVGEHLKGMPVEDAASQLESLLTGKHDSYRQRRGNDIAIKGSPAFYFALRRYAESLSQGETIGFDHIDYRGQRVISKEDILTLLRETYEYLPFRNRLEKIKRRVLYLLEPHERARTEQLKKEITQDPHQPHESAREVARRVRMIVAEETRPIKEMLSRWTAFNMWSAYARMFRHEHRLMQWLNAESADVRIPREQVKDMCRATLRRLSSGRLAYEDVAPFLYLKALLGDLPSKSEVKHVVIDEAQDYSLCHYAVFKHLFSNATFTILGDPDQSIHPYTSTPTLAIAEQVLAPGKGALVELKTSYRSTQQIARFTRDILPRDHINVIEREGKLPRLVQVRDEQEQAKTAWGEIEGWHQAGFEMIAVVCKTAAQCRQAYAALQGASAARNRGGAANRLTLHLIVSAEDRLEKGVVILPAYLAKGLEFDAVLIYDASHDTYSSENERKLFYTACTRALHRLSLITVGKPTSLLGSVDPELYTRETQGGA